MAVAMAASPAMLLASWVGGFLLAVGPLVATAPQHFSPTVEDDIALGAFHNRIEDYLALHRRLEGPLPELRPTTDPFKIYLSRQLLANAIRKARPNARQGDIFTPDVARVFRTIIGQALQGRDVEKLLREPEEEMASPAGLRLEINEAYPADASHAVPPILLQHLPALSGDVEYRIVNRALVLWDIHANLVVDVLPDAFPRETT
jgi:hypothetical protein